ncbi:DUF5683 domain-containing protein [Pseudochryseolinea flava]|uniref:DUF5683 domain-containing protein n=1 Tax=Pseudochryseolinea flava TaxID=2059302 RepID=A0A364Y0H0_9BACT|nr:DUF5683 domain-containing protein [Pseudochryseolinea flava]RAV99584.1 hypothetical protein DQQ10_18465 [Pseudochryseolinea flava]
MKRFFYILSFCILLLPGAFAQDSLRVVNTDDDGVVRDTVLLKSYATRYSPRKALLYAAILPGLGQIYNKKYWKLPLVYGGFISIGYGFNFYQNLTKEYKSQLFYNLNQAPNDENFINPESNAPTRALRSAVDRSQRERDFMVILMAGMYLLQIVDAHVDAHLKEFDLNPNLKVSIEPTMEQNSLIGRQTGVGLFIRF